MTPAVLGLDPAEQPAAPTDPPHSFEVVDEPGPVSVDLRLGRLGPALARFPLHAVHQLQVTDDPTVPTGLPAGIALVDRAVDGGAAAFTVEALLDDVPALAVLAVVLNLEPITALGTAPHPQWTERLVAVRSLLPALRPQVADPAALLVAAASDGLAQLVGVLAQAAVRRTPVLLAGSAPVVAAAVLANRLAPGAAAWWIAAETTATPASTAGLNLLALEPLLDLRVADRGVHLALAVLRAATKV